MMTSIGRAFDLLTSFYMGADDDAAASTDATVPPANDALSPNAASRLNGSRRVDVNTLISDSDGSDGDAAVGHGSAPLPNAISSSQRDSMA